MYNTYDNYKLYTKGKENYLRDIDMTSIIATIHQTKILTDIVMGERQQYLSKFSKYRNLEENNELNLHPMRDVVIYKNTKFKDKDKEQELSEKINEIAVHLENNAITNTDFKLINQVLPNLLDNNLQNSLQNSNIFEDVEFLRVDQKPDFKKETSITPLNKLANNEVPFEERYHDEISSFDYPILSLETLRKNERKT